VVILSSETLLPFAHSQQFALKSCDFYQDVCGWRMWYGLYAPSEGIASGRIMRVNPSPRQSSMLFAEHDGSIALLRKFTISDWRYGRLHSSEHRCEVSLNYVIESSEKRDHKKSPSRFHETGFYK